MTLAITQLHQIFVAEVTGINITKPIDEENKRAIEHAIDHYAVCVLPGQHIDDEQQIAFAGLYGPLELSPPKQDKSGTAVYNTRVQRREIFDISNLDEDGRILDERDARSIYRLGNELLATDSSFPRKSGNLSIL